MAQPVTSENPVSQIDTIISKQPKPDSVIVENISEPAIAVVPVSKEPIVTRRVGHLIPEALHLSRFKQFIGIVELLL